MLDNKKDYSSRSCSENSCTITKSTLLLEAAQKSLGKGDSHHRQAIIPMHGSKAGDPHNLPKQWEGGSMWWLSYGEITEMSLDCEKSVEQRGIPDSF